MATKKTIVLEKALFMGVKHPLTNPSHDMSVKIEPNYLWLLGHNGVGVRLTRGDLADIVRLLIEADGTSVDVFDALLEQEDIG